MCGGEDRSYRLYEATGNRREPRCFSSGGDDRRDREGRLVLSPDISLQNRSRERRRGMHPSRALHLTGVRWRGYEAQCEDASAGGGDTRCEVSVHEGVRDKIPRVSR